MIATTTTQSIDWIERAGARPKGRRPMINGDIALEQLTSILMAVTAEVSVLRERLDTVERLLEAKGSITRADIEAYAPDDAAGRERGLMTRAYIARVMRGMQQTMEAMDSFDPPIDDIAEELSRG
ncbi:hypothetical protein [Parapedomonas caeni]|jgi:hypothetical protein